MIPSRLKRFLIFLVFYYMILICTCDEGGDNVGSKLLQGFSRSFINFVNSPIGVRTKRQNLSKLESKLSETKILQNHTTFSPSIEGSREVFSLLMTNCSRENQHKLMKDNPVIFTFTTRRKRSNANFSPVFLSKDGRKVLTILGLFEFTYNNTVKRKDGESEKLAAEMALEDINANKSILPGYQLFMHTNDTQCDSGSGTDAFFHALYSKNISTKIISLLGTACSEVTERIAKVATHQRILQVSFGSTSPSLSDRKEFPLFYRTVAPQSSHAQAIISTFTHFNWDTFSVFQANENRFTMPANHLVKEMEEKGNISLRASLTFSISDYKLQLKVLKELDSRIIIASLGDDVAPHVFCEIFKQQMYGSDYAWILIGKPEYPWWNSSHPSSLRYPRSFPNSHNYNETSDYGDNSKKIFSMHSNGTKGRKISYFFRKYEENKLPIKLECSQEELGKAVENALVVDRLNALDVKMVSDFGLTTESFTNRLKAKLKNRRNSSGKMDSEKSNISQFSLETYDAVFLIALGLKKLLEKYNYSLESFNYKDDKFARLFNEEIGKLKFGGISGPITFSGSDRIGITLFMQVLGGKLREVGLFYPDRTKQLDLWSCPNSNTSSSDKLYFSTCHSIQWPGDQVPIASRHFRIKIIRVEKYLYIVVAAVALLGILMAVIFLAFNLYYRKLKYIKLSSPNLNNFILVGGIFNYVVVIILGSDHSPSGSDGRHFSYICTIRAYLLSCAFSLAFGAMFAKTYRVHRIFTRSCIGVVKNKLLRDTQLMTLIMSLLLIDVIIVTSWAAFDPMHRHLKNLKIEIDKFDRSVVYQFQIEVCSSGHLNTWLGLLYGYKSLFLLLGIYMAWETRHVKVHALNDSKNIAYCVYVVVLTSVLAVTLSNLISEQVTLTFVLLTSLILTSTTVTLCLLFLPKIHAIKTGQHKGDQVVESMGLKIEFNTRRLVAEDAKELMFRAEVQNRVYKRQIEAIDVEIWRLENLLLCSNHSSLNASVDNLKNMGNEIRASSKDLEDTAEENSESEIYTVYLHGPKFIVPISVLNFQNPNANLEKMPYFLSSNTLAPHATPPRSSWPNIRSLLSPSNGIITKMHFKSEPKLLTENSTNASTNSGLGKGVGCSNTGVLLEPAKVTFGDSDESFVESKSISKISGKSSRKSSNTSCGNELKGTTKRGLLNMLKQPFHYLSGIVRLGGGEGGDDNRRTCKLEDEFEYNCDCEDCEPEVFHLHVPTRPKFSSAPDLWAVRSSPELQNYVKKTSIISDSVVDTSSLRLKSHLLGHSSSNPVLQLTVTSDESPYL